LRGFALAHIVTTFRGCSNFRTAERGRWKLPAPGLTTTCSFGEPAMANRAHSTLASVVRDRERMPSLAAYSASYRPDYARRALAHLATGSLPPLHLQGLLTFITSIAASLALGVLFGSAIL
jgi:hypothetical protein